MTVNAGMISSDFEGYGTPQPFYDLLDKEFHFTLDVCATLETSKHDNFFSVEDDALAQDWTGVAFMNPPYGRQIGKWVSKARRESITNGCTVVCLLPARTDTQWWHKDVMMASEIRLVEGRLRFLSRSLLLDHGAMKNLPSAEIKSITRVKGKKADAAPFPSAVVIFRPEPGDWPTIEISTPAPLIFNGNDYVPIVKPLRKSELSC